MTSSVTIVIRPDVEAFTAALARTTEAAHTFARAFSHRFSERRVDSARRRRVDRMMRTRDRRKVRRNRRVMSA